MSASVQQHDPQQQTETVTNPVRVSVSQLTFDGSPPMPHYPRQARLKGYEGLVVVRISIDRLGRIEQSHVVRSSGFDLLDAAALEASTALRFKPYRVNAMSQRTVVDMPFNFLLNK
jgi:protein TonB